MRSYQPDILASGLDVVFCGINPALTAQADGYNFSSPTNRFWAAIHRAGFTDRQLAPSEERSLLDYGCGITAVVTRPTSGAHELSALEIRQSLGAFEARMRGVSPRMLAFLGKAAWVLPNPSGRNRRFTLGALVTAYAELHVYLATNRSR
jgi:TDG/mug DNA glycosylase family protein